MATAARTKALRLTLQANDVLPEGLTWRIHEGYLRTATWNEEGDAITLGLWGPGDLVTNASDPQHRRDFRTQPHSQCRATAVDAAALAWCSLWPGE
jgi:hypothetical protein